MLACLKKALASREGHLLLTRINFKPAWISNHMLSKVRDAIAYPFPNFNGITVEFWGWISNFIPQSWMYVIISMMVLQLIHISNGDVMLVGPCFPPRNYFNYPCPFTVNRWCGNMCIWTLILNELIYLLLYSIPLHTIIDSTPSLSHLYIDVCPITLDSCMDPERPLFTTTIKMIYWR